MSPRVACVTIALCLTASGCGQGTDKRGGPQLERYLNRVLIEQQRYEHTRAHALSALRHASTRSPDRSWHEAARQLRKADREYDQLIHRMLAIPPPPSLESEHAGMIKSLQLYERLVAQLERPLGKRDVVAMGRTLSTTTILGIRANELRNSWRFAAHARANRLGLHFPVTLEHVGRQLGDAPAAA
jgi:hypothetical protein